MPTLNGVPSTIKGGLRVPFWATFNGSSHHKIEKCKGGFVICGVEASNGGEIEGIVESKIKFDLWLKRIWYLVNGFSRLRDTMMEVLQEGNHV